MQQLEMIAQYAVQIDVPEGKELVRDGALAWDFYVIEEGSAEVRHGQTKLGTLSAGISSARSVLWRPTGAGRQAW
jgi:hypothetical protein